MAVCEREKEPISRRVLESEKTEEYDQRKSSLSGSKGRLKSQGEVWICPSLGLPKQPNYEKKNRITGLPQMKFNHNNK